MSTTPPSKRHRASHSTQKTLLQVLCLVTCLLLASCTVHEHHPYDKQGFAQPRHASYTSGFYDYNAATPEPILYPLPFQQVAGYHLQGIQFASSEDNGQPDNLVDARYFRSLKPGKKPLLIVLPIWATHSFPSTVVANGFAAYSEGGANVLWLQGDGALFDWFQLAGIDSEEAFRDAVAASAARFRAVAIDTRRLIDWAETKAEIDPQRIAIIGFSMGALVAANVAGNDPRIHTAVYVLGGARPWHMMAECNLVVEYVRKQVSADLDWSQEQYRAFFRDQLRYGDPAMWQGRYRAENTLIIESSRDDCIPAASRAALFNATGQPERILYPYNHWQPFLSMTPVGRNILSRDIFEFLGRKLLQPPGEALTPGPHQTRHVRTPAAD